MSKTTQGSRYGVGSKIAGVFLSAAMLASSFLGVGGVLSVPAIQADAASDYGLADNIQDGNILHCFCWKYTDITSMLPEIAEAGFTSIQVSPPQATSGTGAWWWVYQPKGFYIGSTELGNKEQLKTLCKEADEYGIKIIADIVANHLAGDHSVIQDDLKDSQYWHDYAGNADDGDRYRVTHGKIGMPDLNTEHSYVQQCVYNYVQELKSVGIDGIRFDAAKHIGLPSEGDQFWPNVTKDPDLWYYGEILNNPGLSFDENSGQRAQAISVMKEYSNYIGITDSPYGMTLRNSFNSGTAPSSFGNYCGTWMGLSNSRLVYWGESHDTWSNNEDWGYSNDMSQNVIDRAYAVAASRNGITALYFSRPSSKVKDDIKLGSKGSTHFTSKEVAAVNHFKNAMNGKADYYTVTNNCSVITRKGGGAVIVKGSGSGQVTVENGGGYAEPGTYVDEVSGNTFTVTTSTISGTIGDSGIAVIYDGNIKKSAKVSASPAGGSFTTSVTATLNVSGATSGNYTTSDGQSGTYTNGKTITFGSSVAVGKTVTLTLSATGEDGVQKTETYTFTKKDPSAVTTIYFDNSSYKWSSVYAYIYNKSGTGGGGDTSDGTIHFKDTANWGTAYAYFFANGKTVGKDWPGTAMTKGSSDYYITVPSDATHVVFNNGNNGKQTDDLAVAGVYGYDASGNKYSSTGSSASTVTQNAAWPGVKMTLDASTGYYMYEVPDNLVNGYVVFTESETATTNRYPADGVDGLPIEDTTKLFSAGNSWKAYTPVLPDPEPDVPTVTANKATGSSFTTETMSLTLTLKNAKSGTYSVDGGPVKTFTSSATFNIGEGKIGDSTVTVATTATGTDGTKKTYNFTYEKKYVVKTTSSSANLASVYGTNPTGVGKQATITIDGDASDWSEDMMIARSAAWDCPNHWKGAHENSLVDAYALFAAWDDTNLYIGAQMVNTTDTWQNPGDSSLMDNGSIGNVPLIIALSIDPTSPTLTCKENSTGKSIWNLDGLKFQTHVDKLIYMSAEVGSGEPSLFSAADAQGNTDYTDANACIGFKKGGMEYKLARTNICSSIIGLNNSDDPADIYSDSADWVDYKTYAGSKGTHNTKYDSFFEIKIPLATLGITKDYLTTNGIGAMCIGTRGESALDCVPFDPSMLDNVSGEYKAGDNTSLEKEDVDTITVPLAKIGNGTINPTPTPTPTPTPSTTPLQVNFGTDKSAPQLTTTALTIKGIGIGGTAPYQYTFYVDNTVVKAKNSTATYTWKPSTKGQHTLKCIVTDSTGATYTETKTFTAEGDSVEPTTLTNSSTISATSITKGTALKLTAKASGGTSPYTYTYRSRKSGTSTWKYLGATNVTTATYNYKPTEAGTYDVQIIVKDAGSTVAVKGYTLTVKASTELANNSTISATSVSKGTTVKLTAKATGGTSPYTYTYRYRLSSSNTWDYIGSTNVTTTTASYKPTTAGTYTFQVLVKDAKSTVAVKGFTLKVS